MKFIIVISIMVAFGLLIQHEECRNQERKSTINKLSDWWISKMKSNKTGWMIKMCVLAVIYFLIRLIF